MEYSRGRCINVKSALYRNSLKWKKISVAEIIYTVESSKRVCSRVISLLLISTVYTLEFSGADCSTRVYYTQVATRDADHPRRSIDRFPLDRSNPDHGRGFLREWFCNDRLRPVRYPSAPLRVVIPFIVHYISRASILGTSIVEIPPDFVKSLFADFSYFHIFKYKIKYEI